MTTAAPDFNPGVGRLRMTESVILPNRLHRLKFEQRGRIPDLDALFAKHAPQDGRYIVCSAWMDDHGVGRVQMAWKEKPPQGERND